VAAGKGIGSLNLYSTSEDGFDALDEVLVGMFTGQASVALANAQLYRAAQQLSEQLSEALSSRAVIERAKGALMATHGIDEEQAFALLRERSQRSNRKLRDVAADVLRPRVARQR
jgi:AmiR/NasT family two-component response regulator